MAGHPDSATQSGGSQTDPLAAGFLEREVAAGTASGAIAGRYLLLPPRAPQPGRRYPALLYLHGAGERGGDNRSQVKHLPQVVLDPKFRDLHPGFVIAPQCRRRGTWVEGDRSSLMSKPVGGDPAPDLALALAALRKTMAEEAVDPSAVIVSGISMGGYGTWDAAARFPALFAAAGPVCGGGDESAGARLAGLPVWAWHGDRDPVVPVERSRNMVAAIRKAGGSPRYTELRECGHDAWKAAYGEGGMVPWLLRARRPAAGFTECLDALAAAVRKPGERIVVFGDSLTAAGDGPEGYLTLWRERLETLPEAVRPRLFNAGVGGHRVPDLLRRIDRDVLARKPTAVMIVIGINDVWQRASGGGTPSEEFSAGMKTLADRIVASGAQVVLATPPVIGERWDGSNGLDGPLDEFAGRIRDLARRDGHVLCDYRAEFIGMLSFLNPGQRASGIFTTDQVHMNAAGYRLMARFGAVALAAALGRAG